MAVRIFPLYIAGASTAQILEQDTVLVSALLSANTLADCVLSTDSNGPNINGAGVLAGLVKDANVVQNVQVQLGISLKAGTILNVTSAGTSAICFLQF